MALDYKNLDKYGFLWVLEGKRKINKYTLSPERDSLIQHKCDGKAFPLAIQTSYHSLQLKYHSSTKNRISLIN